MARGKAMPGLKLKSLWPLWLIVLLLLAAMPRPAAGAIGDGPLNDEMAAPATGESTTVNASEDPTPVPAKATTPVDEDPAAATASSKETGRSHPAGTHGPRTPWPDMVPMDH